MQHSKHLRIGAVVLSALFVVAVAQTASAATTVAGSCMPSLPSFSTIQAAVNAVPPVGTVLVCPGSYPEQITITKPLTLKGIADQFGDNAPVVISPFSGVGFNFGAFRAQIVVNGATGVNISNIAVDGANNQINSCTGAFVGILYSDASGTVTKVALRNQNVSFPCELGQAFRVRTSSVALSSNVTITNSSLRAWQFEGIHAQGIGVNVSIQSNYLAGLDNNHSPGNAIALEFGATGTVTGNHIADAVWVDDVYPDFFDATWGILLQCVQGVTASANTIGSTQAGIVVGSWFCSDVANVPRGDLNTVTGNKIFNIKLYDGIYVCGDSNVIQNNTIDGAGEAGIKVDNSCDGATANNNSLTSNKINESCAGFLMNGAFVSTSGNTFSNVFGNEFFAPTCGPLFGDPEPGVDYVLKNLAPDNL